MKKYLLLLLSLYQFAYPQSIKWDSLLDLSDLENRRYHSEEFNYKFENEENTTSATSKVTWKKLNGPYGGYITSFDAKGDTMIIGTGYDHGLIFYSTDQGKNWHQSNFREPELVQDLCLLPGGGALAGTLPRHINTYGGAYYSSDFINWKQLIGLAIGGIPKVGYDLNGVIYAGSTISIVASTDLGRSWQSAFYEMYNHGNVYDFLLNDNGDLFAIYGERILRKKNDAQFNRWEVCNIQKKYFFSQPDDLFKGPNGKLFAISNYELFVSNDSGKNWFPSPGPTPIQLSSCIYNKRMIGSFEWSADKWGVGVSDDEGKTWFCPNKGLIPQTNGKVISVGKNIFFATDGSGIYKSKDLGESWKPSNKGFTASYVYDFLIDTNTGYWFTASSSHGIQKSADNGETWKDITAGINDRSFSSIIMDLDGVIYASSTNGIYKSTNKGKLWQKLITTFILNNDFALNLYVDKNNRLYCTNWLTGLYRSSDKGETWQRLDSSFKIHEVASVFFDKKNNIYASCKGGMIYKSTDDGTKWKILKDYKSDKHYGGHFSFGADGSLLVTSSWEGVYKSTDEGKTWNLFNKGLKSERYNRIILNEKTSELYLIGRENVYYSDNNGETWQNILGNIRCNYFQNIKIINDEVYLCTKESLWKLEHKLLDVDNTNNNQLIEKYFISQNYPNPFNPTTTIKYSIPEKGLITIKVFDLIGREIKTLINEEKQTGNYEVTFNADGLPSGIYFLFNTN